MGNLLNDKAVERISGVVRYVEGVQGSTTGRHRIPPMRSGKAPRHTPFRVTASSTDANGRESYTAKRQAVKKTSTGYGGWADSTTDTEDYTLYAPSEELTPGSSGFEVDDIIFAIRVSVDGEDAEWWIVGGAAGGTTDDPLDLTYAGEHDESALTDDGWDRSDQGENDGLTITMSTGAAYYDDGDETLYGYVRDMTFDSSGRLVLASAERRVVIETPEVCEEEA